MKKYVFFWVGKVVRCVGFLSAVLCPQLSRRSMRLGFPKFLSVTSFIARTVMLASGRS